MLEAANSWERNKGFNKRTRYYLQSLRVGRSHAGPLNHTASNTFVLGTRYSSVVRAFAHGAMGRQIDPSWSGPIDYFSQCSMTGVTKAVVCVILSVGWCI